MRLNFLLILSFLMAAPMMAQDTLLTMSGYEIPCNITDMEGFEVKYEITKRNGKVKNRGMHKSEIFAVIDDGVENVLYGPDPILGDDLSVQEMRIFIAGEQDARAFFDTKPTFYVGMVLAGAAAVIANGAFIATFAVPIIYPLIQLAPVIKIKEKYISDPNHRYNEVYAAGFESVARSKKVLAGLKGAAIGALVGAVVIAIISPDN